MTHVGERVFRLLLRAYPRAFRERYEADLLAFFRADRERHGSSFAGTVRFWTSTLRDLSRAAAAERLPRLPAADPTGRRELRRIGATLAFDLRNAVRSLRATPAVTLTAFLVLALGIGAGTAIFAVVDGVVLRGLPFADEDRLVAIAETELTTGRMVSAAYPNYAEWLERQDVFESMGGSVFGPFVTTLGDRPERLRTHKVSANLFDILQARPAIGSGFTPEDERTNARVALLSDETWRRLFGADPSIVGRTIRFDTGTYVVRGIMPRGFRYPIGAAVVSAVDLWIPLALTPRDLARTGGRNYAVRVVAKLKPEVSLEQASARMQQIRDVMAVEYPTWFTDYGVRVRRLKDSIVGVSTRSWMLMLLYAVAAVFLVACANVANLLLTRAAGRTREIGVRAAMGATRWQIVRGLMVESVLLALAGAAGGVALAYWGVDILKATLPPALPRVWSIAVDLRVVLVAALTATVTGALCGLLPALQLSRTDVSAALRSSGRSATADAGRQRIRTVFLMAEVALAAVLLVGAGVFASSFIRLVNRDLGFSPSRVLSIVPSPPLPVSREAIDESRAAFQQSMIDALARVRALPGVEAAALVAGGAPLTGSWASQPIQVEGRTFTGDDEVVHKQVTADYFEVVGATLLQGRPIAVEDRRGAPAVVVLNDEAVRRYLGGRPPVGAQIAIDNEPPRTVVGVVRGMRLLGPETEVRPEAYVPYEQSTTQSVSASLLVRTAQEPGSLIPAVKEAIWSVIPGLLIPDPRTFDEMFAALVAQRKLNMILLGIFGALAVLIASIGIYGMLAYSIEQRTKEIGVRMALGAIPAAIMRMVLGRAALTIGVGLAAGFLAAAWLERLVMAFVFEGVPRDPVVYGGAAALLLVLGLTAALVPARRAARVDPLVALRSE